MGGCRRACLLGVCGLAIPTKGRFVQRNILTFLPPFPKGKRPLALRRTSVPLAFSSSPNETMVSKGEQAQGLPGQALSPLEGLGLKTSRKRNTWRRVQRGRSVYFAENAKLVNQQALCSPSSKRLVIGRNILVFFGFYQRERYIIKILINFLAMFNQKTKSTLKVQKSLRLLTVSPVSMKYADIPVRGSLCPFQK